MMESTAEKGDNPLRSSDYGVKPSIAEAGESIEDEKFYAPEIAQMFRMYPYVPKLNGPINSEYYEFLSKLKTKDKEKLATLHRLGQFEFTSDYSNLFDSDDYDVSKPLLLQSQLIKCPSRVVQQQVQRIIKMDENCTEKVRDKVCLQNDACQKVIEQNGETILITLRCVAFLNAPQSNEDHLGDSRLFLTRHSTNGNVFHRLYFYSYGEAPSLTTKEVAKSQDKFNLFNFFEEDHFIVGRASSRLDKKVTEEIKRSATGNFVSLSLADVISLHHTCSDYAEIKSFSSAHSYAESTVKFGNYSCLRQCLECQCCSVCYTFCCWWKLLCNCKLVVSFFEEKKWNWQFTAKQKENDLSRLVCDEIYSVEKDLESLQYDPLNEKEVCMSSVTTTSLKTKRFHTINVTYRNMETSVKHRGVAVLAPDEDSALAIDLVCQLTSLIDDQSRDEKWHTVTKEMTLSNRNPLRENAHLRGKEDIMNLFFGNWDSLQETIGWEYRIGVGYLSILFALIAACACIAALVGW